MLYVVGFVDRKVLIVGVEWRWNHSNDRCCEVSWTDWQAGDMGSKCLYNRPRGKNIWKWVLSFQYLKVKLPHNMPWEAQSGAKRYSSPPGLTLVLFGIGGQYHSLTTLPLKEDPAHIVQMVQWFQICNLCVSRPGSSTWRLNRSVH